MPLWTDAYLADTHPDLTLEEHGCYMLLLMAAWRRPRCALPDDDAWFCRWLGVHGNKWRTLRASILDRFFTQIDEGFGREFVQKRLRKERDFLEEQSRKQRERASKRWAKSNTANGLADPAAYAASGNAPTPTPTPNKKERKNGDASVDASLGIDVLFFRRGKAMLGDKAGGQLAKLRDAVGGYGRGLEALDQAATKENPAEYVAAIIKKRPGQADPFLL